MNKEALLEGLAESHLEDKRLEQCVSEHFPMVSDWLVCSGHAEGSVRIHRTVYRLKFEPFGKGYMGTVNVAGVRIVAKTGHDIDGACVHVKAALKLFAEQFLVLSGGES